MSDRSHDEFAAWLTSLAAFKTVPWNELPQLELYMDQVITLINRGLEPLLADGDRAVTPSMINNYVKAEVLPRPTNKRYDREHLTLLSLVCMLKSELSLQEIRELLDVLTVHYSTEELYNGLSNIQVRYLKEAAARVGDLDALSDAQRCRLATELALEANAKRLLAAKLIASTVPEDKDRKKKKDN